ncbi:trans-sialidase [Trypanosoma conorhini]|uniref:Trans-sialidase n=1 Tax=Trypanosoma conorhini TaxID=83891 RepID=A0A3R7NDQ1_9TRYP|nr:trans-sialidase [Trypanosoma conorhini]RNF01152.1 trans-sialidase [Trypanosoma conorhini]
MPRHTYSAAVLLLFCVLLICCGSGASASDQRDVKDPFTGTTEITESQWKDSGEQSQTVSSLRVPSLVAVGEDVFAVAEAQCANGDSDAGCFVGIASKHLKQTAEGAMEISAAEASFFRTQFLKKGEKEAMDIMRPTTLVRGTDVYMLLGNYSRTAPTDEATGTNGWGLLLVKGTVTGEDGAKKLTWSNPMQWSLKPTQVLTP